ncbi:MAG TPA: MarR family transcriptional regulator [Actinospica sp.]|nr:MarR family transcriptional regulator [Actinospica sp.]
MSSTTEAAAGGKAEEDDPAGAGTAGTGARGGEGVTDAGGGARGTDAAEARPAALVPGSEAWLESIPRLATAGRALALALLSLQTATARALGIHPTDVAIIAHLQPMPGEPRRTPGDLARLTGLTTGAITGVIDRLERDGYVRRVRDSSDRRKIFVELTGKDMETFSGVFGPMMAELDQLCAKFSPAELAMITDYLEGCRGIMQHAVGGMQEG